ncbi:replication-relaxation family protein [Actinomadura macra]|uniref:replication-relaxation family protein n=1 Tax=Actinomadura macra TaxID=46164 RepID=UPI0008310EA6|nr:replication-relaxation family protein [Actinomadura macra]
MTDRPSGARAARLRCRLSDRDLAVLRDLYRLRLLKTSQIERLHFAENSPHTSARRARACVQRLSELGLVARMARSIGGVRAGSSGQVIGLSGLGCAVLDVDGIYGARRRTVWTTKPAFQDHVLTVAELFAQLVERTRDGVADLLSFDGEPAAWRWFTGPHGAPAILKPDAYTRLGIGDIERSAFIEMDMGTERAPTLTRKLQAFVDYWRSGIEQQATGVFPLVLWLVPDDTRKKKLTEVITQMTHESHKLFLVALHGDGAALLAAPTGEEA